MKGYLFVIKSQAIFIFGKSCATDGGWGVQKIEKTARDCKVQSSRQLPPCILPVQIRGHEQKYQFEGSDFIHRPQCLEQRDFRGQTSSCFDPEDDNELGEHGGCYCREYLHDSSVAGVCASEIAYPILNLQRPEDFELQKIECRGWEGITPWSQSARVLR